MRGRKLNAMLPMKGTSSPRGYANSVAKNTGRTAANRSIVLRNASMHMTERSYWRNAMRKKEITPLLRKSVKCAVNLSGRPTAER